MGVLGQNRGRGGAILTPNELVFILGVLTSVYTVQHRTIFPAILWSSQLSYTLGPV